MLSKGSQCVLGVADVWVRLGGDGFGAVSHPGQGGASSRSCPDCRDRTGLVRFSSDNYLFILFG